MEIKVLGSAAGCANCKKLEENTLEAAAQLGIDADIQKITDVAVLMSYGVMSPPALAVDGELKVSGRVPSVQEIKDILKG